MPSWNRNGTRCVTIILFDFHGIFSCLFHSSKYYYCTIPQYHNTKFVVCPELNSLKCWQEESKKKYLTFIVLSFRYVSRLSKSMTKSKKSIKPLQISRRIQYTLEGLGVHMKRNLQGTQTCGHHPLQLRETTGICSTTVKHRNAIKSWLFNFTYSILSHVLGCTKLLKNCRKPEKNDSLRLQNSRNVRLGTIIDINLVKFRSVTNSNSDVIFMYSL